MDEQICNCGHPRKRHWRTNNPTKYRGCYLCVECKEFKEDDRLPPTSKDVGIRPTIL